MTTRLSVQFVILFLFAFPPLKDNIAAYGREVLIYYANETAPTGLELDNYINFETWLDGLGSNQAERIAAALRRDRTLFTSVVQSEIADIRKAIEGEKSDLGIVIVTNSSVRNGYIEYYHPQRGWKQKEIHVPEESDYIRASNPLASPANFEQILCKISKCFDPTVDKFILVCKSHGSRENAMVVMLSRHFETSNLEALKSTFEGFAVSDEISELTIGVRRSEVLSVLKRVGVETEMRFSVVFLESCRGVISSELANQLPGNVDRLFASGDRFLSYQTLDYPKLLHKTHTSGSLEETINTFLAPRYQSAIRKRTKGVWQQPAIISLAVLLAVLLIGPTVVRSISIGKRKSGEQNF